MENLNDMFSLFKTEFSKDGTRLSDVFKACVKSVWELPKGIYIWLKEKVTKAADYITDTKDDGLEIRADQKGVLGIDMKDMYLSKPTTITRTTVDKDGNSLDIEYLDFRDKLNATSSRDTCLNEMHGSNLSRLDNADYASLPPMKQVAYEYVLAAKKYANGQYLPDANGNAMTFEQVANKYKDYCSQNNIDWNEVTWCASEEFQHESEVANKNLGYAFGHAENYADLRFMANTCHNMILEMADETYHDQSCVTDISYEATLDTSTVPYGYFATKVEAAKQLFDGKSPMEAMKEGAVTFVDNLSYATAVTSLQHDMQMEREHSGDFSIVSVEEAQAAYDAKGTELTQKIQARNEAALAELDGNGTQTADASAEVSVPDGDPAG